MRLPRATSQRAIAPATAIGPTASILPQDTEQGRLRYHDERLLFTLLHGAERSVSYLVKQAPQIVVQRRARASEPNCEARPHDADTERCKGHQFRPDRLAATEEIDVGDDLPQTQEKPQRRDPRSNRTLPDRNSSCVFSEKPNNSE